MVSVAEAQAWTSDARYTSLRSERVALDIASHRILHHLTLTLENPIPIELLEMSRYLCLGWPLGGIWKITKRDVESRTIVCIAWKKTELSAEEVAELNQQYAPAPAAAATAAVANQALTARLPAKALFDWEIQLATRHGKNHWFVREVGPPPALAPELQAPTATPLSVKLFVGPAPVEVALVVNSIHDVNTVAQRFTADVTWELTLPSITATREDSVLRELLDMLEFKEEEFEFSNQTDVRSEKPIVMAVLPKSAIDEHDQFVCNGATQSLHNLKYSRRIIAEFSEEMTLQTFPLDQQKLTFSLNMGKGIASFMPIAPVAGNPGRFVLDNFKLGNVWKAECGDMIFVGCVDNAAKTIRFEMMLERRSTYYLTNVAIPAAFITYLCFSSYAPLKDEHPDDAKGATLMDTDARLQIVLTLLLTAVTFKNQVASLIPQVSYFTTLDKYVFVCFIIACAVAVETALFPLTARWWGKTGSWREYYLLWTSVWVFTIINVVWGVQLYRWTCERSQRIKVLMDVTVYARAIAIASDIPNDEKKQMVRAFLARGEYKPELMPEFVKTKGDAIFLKLPSDSPAEDHRRRTKHDATRVHDQATADVAKRREKNVAITIQGECRRGSDSDSLAHGAIV